MGEILIFTIFLPHTKPQPAWPFSDPDFWTCQTSHHHQIKTTDISPGIERSTYRFCVGLPRNTTSFAEPLARSKVSPQTFELPAGLWLLASNMTFRHGFFSVQKRPKLSTFWRVLVGGFEVPKFLFLFIFTISIVRLAETLHRNGCQGIWAHVQRLFSDLRSKVQEDRHESFLPSSCCSVQHAFCVGICTWSKWRDYIFQQKLELGC